MMIEGADIEKLPFIFLFAEVLRAESTESNGRDTRETSINRETTDDD